jgi:TetR/AcrR family transcriptional regulator
MESVARQVRIGPRAERTRAAILQAAEALFAERGFSSTRLEDVAERVGIRRASIVYYFRDKRELYEAVLSSVFGGLLEVLEEALSGPEPLRDRAEAAVSAWVEYVGRRPSVARIVLREVANAGRDQALPLLRHTQPFFDLIRAQVFHRAEPRRARAEPFDTVQIASTIVGATVFLVAAMPALVPELEIDPVRPEHLESHRQELLRIVRRLLDARSAQPQRRPAPGRKRAGRGRAGG